MICNHRGSLCRLLLHAFYKRYKSWHQKKLTLQRLPHSMVCGKTFVAMLWLADKTVKAVEPTTSSPKFIEFASATDWPLWLLPRVGHAVSYLICFILCWYLQTTLQGHARTADRLQCVQQPCFSCYCSSAAKYDVLLSWSARLSPCTGISSLLAVAPPLHTRSLGQVVLQHMHVVLFYITRPRPTTEAIHMLVTHHLFTL